MNQTHQTVNQAKIPERITRNRRRSHSRINQEEVSQTHQAESQVKIQFGSIGQRQVQVDSREWKLSRVKTGTGTSARGTKYSDKSTWRICQSDPKIPPADKQSVQVKQNNRKRRQHWHKTRLRYPVQFTQIVPPYQDRAPQTLQQTTPTRSTQTT